MPTETHQPRDSARTALKALALCAMAGPFHTVGAAVFAGNDILPILLASLALSGFALAALRLSPASGRMTVALANVGQIMVLTAAFAGHPWQIDSHMAYFATLAMLIALMDFSVVLAAAAAVVVQHLGLTVLLPVLIYPDGDLFGNVARTLMHGAIVAVEVVVIVVTIRTMRQLNRDNAEQLAHAEQMSAEMAREKADAENARALAEKAEADAMKSLEESRRATARADEERLRKEAAEADAKRRDAEVMAHRERTAAELRKVMEELRFGLSQLADGRLDIRIESPFPETYEALRMDFNTTMEGLAQTIGDVTAHILSVETDVRSISETTTNLSDQTESQSSSLQSTSSSIDALTTAVQHAAAQAREANEKVRFARQSANDGERIVGDAVAAMRGIEEASQQISQVTSLIDDIAFQTSLLALNAGVEAARAGEAGKSFAVVASEVRDLALRSSDAAREIGTLIAQSDAQVKNGVSQVERTGEALEGIIANVADIATLIDGVQSSAETQSTGISAINETVSQIGSATQHIVAVFEETSAASISVSNDVMHLRSLVSQFRVTPTKAHERRDAKAS
ncbi:methyl-accepting chemotaxis protein [Poseidonocella pacifica]|uniref:Methyl-accepting chemotaxis protein n=1 Tax=Poseidonocella pacifica TaxID=871651 RepID=A0A1I0WGU6_9RHOB|nr:methyl-accepting chemotaxis protein [Poseidonocella pacifica]SFA87989.1 methyl-accepting chemotaxis protein [Poseidonocella pacifica]